MVLSMLSKKGDACYYLFNNLIAPKLVSLAGMATRPIEDTEPVSATLRWAMPRKRYRAARPS